MQISREESREREHTLCNQKWRQKIFPRNKNCSTINQKTLEQTALPPKEFKNPRRKRFGEFSNCSLFFSILFNLLLLSLRHAPGFFFGSSPWKRALGKMGKSCLGPTGWDERTDGRSEPVSIAPSERHQKWMAQVSAREEERRNRCTWLKFQIFEQSYAKTCSFFPPRRGTNPSLMVSCRLLLARESRVVISLSLSFPLSTRKNNWLSLVEGGATQAILSPAPSPPPRPLLSWRSRSLFTGLIPRLVFRETNVVLIGKKSLSLKSCMVIASPPF